MLQSRSGHFGTKKNALVPNLNLIFRTVLYGTTPPPKGPPRHMQMKTMLRYIKVLVQALYQLLSYPVFEIRNKPLTGAYPEFFPGKWEGRWI